MAYPLNILIIEDSEADFDLILYHLRLLDSTIISDRVETTKSLRTALDENTWDIVISDHILPSFSATEALGIIQELELDIPFIIVSGLISEDTAVDLMKAGASDYIFKDRLARLCPVVKRELNFARIRRERRESQTALQKSEEWSNLIYNTTSDSMFLLEVKPNNIYRCLTVNQAYLTSTGLQKEQVIGKQANELLLAHNVKYILRKYEEAIRVGRTIQYEETAELPSGMVVVETTLTPIYDDNGKCIQLLGSSHDITERKRAEIFRRESEEKFRQIVETSNSIFYRQYFHNSQLEYISPKVIQILGYNSQELMDWDIGTQLSKIHPEDKSVLTNFRNDLVEADEKGKGFIEREFRLLNKQEKYQWIHGKYSLIRDLNNYPHLIIGNLYDITDRKFSEKKLRESEKKFRLLAEHIQVGVVIHSSDSKVLFSNKEAQRLLGLSEEEMLGKQASDPVWHLIDKDGTSLTFEQYPVNLIISTKEMIKQVVYGVYRPSIGDYAWVIVNGYPVFDSNQILNQVVISFVDITPLKQTEDSLQISEQHYRSLFNNSSIAIWEMDFSSVYEYINDLRHLGISDLSKHLKDHPQEIEHCAAMVKNLVTNPKSIALLGAASLEELKKNIYAFLTDEIRAVFKNVLLLFSDGQRNIKCDIPLRTLIGDEILLECSLLVPTECSDTLSRVLVYFVDITDRRRAEKALKESHDKLEFLFDVVPVGLSVLNKNHEIVKFNNALEEILGMSTESIMQGNYLNRRYFKPNGTLMSPKEFASSRVINGQRKVMHVETGVEKEDGSIVWTDVSAAACELQDWNTIIVTADITHLLETQRKNLQLLEKLNQKNQDQEKTIELSARLRKAYDLDDAQKILIEQAMTLFSVRAAALFLISEDKFHVSACGGMWEPFHGIHHPKENPIFNHVLNSTHPYFIDSFNESFGVFQTDNNKVNPMNKLNSCTLVPIHSGDMPIGLLILCGTTSKKHLETNTNLLKAFTEIAGITLHRMKSTALTEQLNSRRTKELSALYNVISTASLSMALPKKLDIALNEILQSLECTHGGIFLYDSEKKQIFTAASLNLPNDLKEPIEKAILETSWEGWIITHGEVLVIPNIADNPRFIGINHISQKLTYAGMPIKNNGKTIGVLSVLRNETQVFSIDELSFIHALANHIGVIIENDHLLIQAEKAALHEERSRLARDLHDSVTQTLFSCAFFAETGIKLLDKDKVDQAKDQFNRLSKISQQALKEMRLLIFQLRPEILRTEGLIPAIKQRLELVENKAAVQTHLNVNKIQRLSDSVEDALYWAAIESLNNILKHAQASQVFLQIQMEAEQVIFTIKDNGKGFDPLNATRQIGMGLKNIQERLNKVGGSVEISSCIDEGTTLTIFCPIE